MVDEEQIGFGGNGKLHCRQRGVHRGGDARDSAGILHLKAIGGAVVVAPVAGAADPVALLDECGEGGFRHDAMKSKISRAAKRET